MTDLFAEKLTRLRTQKGLTQRDLAAMTGMSWSQISKYESGKAKPRKKALWALEEALDAKGELSFFADGKKMSVPIPPDLYETFEEVASEAGMTMDEYGTFLMARLVRLAHDEMIGLRPPELFTPEQVKAGQARMKPGEKEAATERRQKLVEAGTDDETMILKEIRERQKQDGRLPSDTQKKRS